jgi:excisionase family DNA binding protein
MATTDRPREVWERVAADLKAYRSAQQSVWGGLDELTVARVLAGTATPDEHARVSRIAAMNPAVAELLDLLRSVVGVSAPTREGMSVAAAARLKGIPQMTVQSAIHRGDLPAARTSEGFIIPEDALMAWQPLPAAAAPGHAGSSVTVYFRKQSSLGLLLRHDQLDADRRTLSVVGPRSLLAGGAVGNELVVRLPNRGLVVGRLTHLHPTRDTYRAEIAMANVVRVGGTMPPPVQTAAPSGRLNWAGLAARRGGK